MEDLDEVIGRYGLEESSEYIIIPFISADGRKKRCFLLKRRFLRIAFEDGHYIDSPIEDAIIAIKRYPDLKVSEALYLIHREKTQKAAAFESAEQALDSDQATIIN
jgi:hypothetical protein